MNLIKKLKSIRHSMWLAYCRTLPIRSNKILLWADDFKSFGCSPKYIAKYLADNYPEKFDVVWVLERDRELPEGFPDNIRIVRYFSMQYLKEIATAKVIVCNSRTGKYHFFKKRKGQYYIQTWHSSLRLKKIEGDAITLSEEYTKFAKADSEKIDLLLSGCAFSTDVFKRAFWYDGEILKKGTPRCDGFFGDNSAAREKVYRYYDIDNSKKLALYAPTFRKDKSVSIHGMDFNILSSALGDDWVIGCRLHPNLNAEIPDGTAIPMSRYPDMQELLQSCDLLITDYSSSMFDMVVAGKKCVLYVPDLEKYMANERGLYFDIEQLPFPKATNMDELCRCLYTWDGYEDACKQFNKQIGSYENGNAAKAVAERIEEVCFGD